MMFLISSGIINSVKQARPSFIKKKKKRKYWLPCLLDRGRGGTGTGAESLEHPTRRATDKGSKTVEVVARC